MTSFAEYTRKKKKEKEYINPAGMTFGEYSRAKLGEDVFKDDDIAPIRTDSKEETTKKRSWFEKGAFEDGYDFGDVTKTILGTNDDIGTNLLAGILGMGERVVDAGAYALGLESNLADKSREKLSGIVGDKLANAITGPAKLFNQEDMQSFIEKDLYDEQKVARYITRATSPTANANYYLNGGFAKDYRAYKEGGYKEYLDTHFNNDTISETSVLGDKSDSLVQSGGQLFATAGLQAVGVPWWLTTGATSFGGEVETAFKEGATYKEAGGSGVITAGADILTEKLFGGIKFGGKALDDTLLKPLTEKISNKTVKTLTNFGIDVFGEGTEEVIASVFSNLGTSLYKEESIEELLTSEEAMDEYLESFIGGAVLGGGANSVKVANSLQTGRDYNTGLSANEQKVVDAEVKKRIEDKKALGETVSKKEQSAIEESVMSDLQNGFIDTDMIESTLGGETYKSYKSILDKESPLRKELEEVRSNRTLTNKQRETLVKAIESEIDTIGETSNKSQIQERLKSEMDALTQNDTFLRESYNEKGRRKEAFNVDLTKYNEKQKAIVQKAVDSGILNNTRKTHDFVDLVAKLSAEKGVSFDFANNKKLKESGYVVEGATVNGLVDKDGNILINIQSNNALNTVVGHEITHILEGTELYQSFQDIMLKYAESKPGYALRYERLSKLYKNAYKNLDEAEFEAKLKKELTADFVGEYLFTDADFVNKLSVEQPNVFQKIYEEIKYMIKLATAGSKEARELEKVKKAFEKAYKETASINNGNGSLEYSLNIIQDRKVADRLTSSEWKVVKASVSNYNKLNYNYQKSADGDIIIPVGDKLVYTDANYDSPGISKIIQIESEYESDIDYAREELYAVEKGESTIEEAYEVIRLFTGIENINEYETENRANDGKYDRRTSRGKSQSDTYHNNFLQERIRTANEIIHSVNNESIAETNKASSQDGVFFDAQKLTKEHSNPTNDADIRFSLSEAVEQTKDLFAIHNLQASELVKSIGLGGLPMPSIAIIKDQQSHEQYGDVSLIFSKDAIDPKATKDNKVYGGDAWTPTYPKIEYKPNDKVAKKIRDKYYELSDKIGYDAVRPMYRYMSELENVLNRDGGESGMLEKLYNDTGMMQVYLEDSGKGRVEPVIKETRTEASETEKEQHQYFLDNERELVNSYKELVAQVGSPMTWHKEHSEEIETAYRKYLKNQFEFTDTEIDNVLANTKKGELVKPFREAVRYEKTGGVTVKTETDYEATNTAIKKKAENGYKDWVDNLFKGVEEKSGIRNNADYYTNSGNPRSWNALHWENTLENVVKAMKGQDQTGADAMSPIASIFAVAQKKYGSIAEIKGDSGRLGKVTEEEYENLKESYSNRFTQIASSIMDTNARNSFIEMDNVAELIIDAIRTQKTKSAMLTYMKKWNKHVTGETVDDIVSLVSDISNMPTGYFEAKPQRAVGLDEVGVFVIPYNADAKLKQELLNRGYSIAEYDPNIEGDRHRVVNQFEEYKFSLSQQNQDIAPVGNYNVYGKDIALETPQEVAPVQEVVQEKTDLVQDLVQDEYAPMTEAQAQERDTQTSDRIYSLTDEDMPVEAEEPIYTDSVEPTSPFEERDIKDVGSRKVNAYMYDHPEVKPYFQEEAEIMLGELKRSVKGERVVNAQLLYDTGGEQGVWGTKRETSEQVAYLLDTFKYSYADLEKGLNAIITDHGAENNAISKRIEFMLDERLREGYTDFETGYEIPSNPEYVQMLHEKQISDYTDESWNYWLETLAQEDIAPVREYEAIEPAPEKLDALEEQWSKNKMARADKVKDNTEEQQIAKVLAEEPKPENKKNRTWAIFRANVFDKGSVFEDLSLKTKNRELMGKWDYTLTAGARAQTLIGQGAEGVKSLNDIIAEVENTGLKKEFYEYMYHKHNVDRMKLEEKYSTPENPVKNKPVFGDRVTAEVSQDIVNQYEFAQPQFMDFAKDVYAYNEYLRQQLVDNGVISQETADLWHNMYPHYVPVSRVDSKGLDVNVPLDTGRTGVNAPIKQAVGGSSDILPLFDTMASRTLQTYKATAKNSFGVELKNTLGTVIDSSSTNVDEVIDSVDAQDGLLQEGKNGRHPTFTVFENGERITFEITEDMYDAFKPLSDSSLLSKTIRPLNFASNFHRGLLTEYNPVFILTNGIKDVQDILINSQHPVKTYAKIPEAFAQLVSKGYWYKEYMKNGGEHNSYFDTVTNTFKPENKGIAKLLDLPPLSTISALNNYVELVPRLSEYIASREAGRSIEVSMLDASRVTTNFKAGGDLTKALNRNGATFLNASVQGAMQQVRNVREAKANGMKGWVMLATKFAVAGVPAMILNSLIWDDDEEYEELSDYVKQNYYIVAKTDEGKFIRIPKGRTIAVIQDAIEQIGNLATGNDEADLKSFLELVVTNIAPANPIENNILAPIIQVANNETWYGEDLVPTRLADLPASEQYDESTDSISRWLGEKLDISPVKINYLLDQYSGGVGDVVLPMLTPEAESGDDSLVGNMIAPLKNKFTVDSVMNNQNVSDIYETSEELTTNAKMSGATDEDILMNKYVNSVKAEMSELYKQKRDIQNSDLPANEKYDRVREIQKQITEIAKSGLGNYENVQIDGDYARVDDRHYKFTEAGEWTKITNEQLEKQESVTSGLGISAGEYWSNKEEFDYAFEKPEKYAVAKAVGDYDTYRTYTKALNDIKADKDSEGKSISGSRKEKVLNYVNNLDADYGAKIILFKSEYPADDTYNMDIIEYLNSRNDISYEEEVNILKELGFTVEADGTVSWE